MPVAFRAAVWDDSPVKFGFLTDPDRTRFSYLRLRRLKKALADTAVLDALVAEMGIHKAAPGGSRGAKLAAIEREIERLRGSRPSAWSGVPAPEVLGAFLFAASKKGAGPGPVADLFTPARDQREIATAVALWLKGTGLTLFDGLPRGTAFDFVGYQKGLLGAFHIVGVAIGNTAGQIDLPLQRMKAFEKLTESTYLACSPAVAAEYLSACATALGKWDADALNRRLREQGVGLLLVEGDAVAQALLPKTRKLDGQTLDSLRAAVESQSWKAS